MSQVFEFLRARGQPFDVPTIVDATGLTWSHVRRDLTKLRGIGSVRRFRRYPGAQGRPRELWLAREASDLYLTKEGALHAGGFLRVTPRELESLRVAEFGQGLRFVPPAKYPTGLIPNATECGAVMLVARDGRVDFIWKRLLYGGRA